ncbi:MAG TPA: tetratricopeptide repeat protein [Thermoanaerobaculia bacterium]|nr:tetratricopeptide repeat protein [Thermoanaerobaculia bacterium]
MPTAPIDDPDVTRTQAAGDLLAPGALVAGRYRIEELVGVGGMGMVYRAHDERLDLRVALKVLRPELTVRHGAEERFVRELILARQVSHRNVVRIHDLGEDRELSFLTMDYVEGRSLLEVLNEEGPLAPARAAEVARQVAEGLAAAHCEGVIHRDLKPANVLLDAGGRAYITDFGVARSLSATGITRAGSVLGTPTYLSPEQARGEEVDGRSDLYSLGIVLYEMLTGELPFRGETPTEQLGQRLTGRPRTLREAGVEVPTALERILARCLAREPEDRYPDAEALAGELAEEFGAGSGGRRGAPGGPGRRLGWSRGRLALRPLLPWAAAVLALALAALAAFRWLPALRPGGAEAGPVHAVAILPLADETGWPELAWAATGVADMLTAVLAESPELRVVEDLRVARTVRDLGLAAGPLSEADARQIADLLDVDRLVVGALRSAGDRLRLDARLLATDRPGLPAEAFHAETGADGDLFRLVRVVGAELRRRLEAAPPEGESEPPAASPAAFAAYSRGTAALLAGDGATAVPALEQAVEEDPAFGAAWLRLAAAYEDSGYLEQAGDAARRAVDELAAASDGRLALEARARAATLAGDPEAARAGWSALVERYPHDTAARCALAEAYGEEGRFPEAREVLDRVVAAEPDHPRAWYLLGKFAILAGDARRAADEYLVRALVVQNRLGNAKGRADALNALGIAHGELGETERAVERYEEAAAVRQRIGDRRGYAASLTNLGTLQFLAGDFDAGRARLEEALAIRSEIGDRQGLAYLENEFGILEEERGRYTEALEHFRRALQMRQELGDRRAIAESLNNVGFAYYLLGELDNAGVYWQQALEVYRSSGNREGVVIAGQSLGLLDLVRGDWAAALRRFVEALEASRELGARQAEAVSLGNLGRVAQLQGRYGAAFDSYARALAVVEELQDSRGLAEFTLLRSSALVELGNLEAAEAGLERAEEWLAEGGNQEQEAELARLRGEIALARGELASARRSFGRALELARSSGGLLPELEARRGTARADLAAGRPDAAAAALATVVEEARAAGSVPILLAATADLAEARWRSGDLAGAEEAARGALRRVAGSAGYGEAWRLHLLLAEVQAERGDSAGAGRSWSAAAAEVARVRGGLHDEERRAFERLPEVERIAERSRAV